MVQLFQTDNLDFLFNCKIYNLTRKAVIDIAFVIIQTMVLLFLFTLRSLYKFIRSFSEPSCVICSAWSASPCPAGPSRKFWTSCFGWGPAGCSFSAGSSSATAGCGCTWPCACCWGQRLIFFCSAPGPGGRWTSWPGPPPGFWAG